jgi:DNA-binding MarR family transcriptional regulator
VNAPAAIREKHGGALAERSNVRLWLRLLSCAMTIEKALQRRLTERFATTLPRFDVLAALERSEDGLTMGELSRALLVSNGNVTAIVRKLAQDGMVATAPHPADRRVSVVRLTAQGSAHFAAVAEAHHGWVDELLAGLSRDERRALYDALGRLKLSLGGAAARELSR